MHEAKELALLTRIKAELDRIKKEITIMNSYLKPLILHHRLNDYEVTVNTDKLKELLLSGKVKYRDIHRGGGMWTEWTKRDRIATAQNLIDQGKIKVAFKLQKTGQQAKCYVAIVD